MKKIKKNYNSNNFPDILNCWLLQKGILIGRIDLMPTKGKESFVQWSMNQRRGRKINNSGSVCRFFFYLLLDYGSIYGLIHHFYSLLFAFVLSCKNRRVQGMKK